MLAAYQVPAQRRAPGDVAYGAASKNRGQMTSVQTVSRPDGAHILGGECLPTLHIFHNEQRSAKPQAGLLTRTRSKLRSPQCLFSKAYRIHHFSEFIRLQRERTIRTVVRSR